MSYIKLDRDLLYSYSFANPNHLKIWIWLLIKANFKTAFIPLNVGKGFKTIEVKRGQLIFGRNKAEDELGLNGSLIYRTLLKFQELGQINIEVNNHYSVITICNYDSYQSKSDEVEQPMNSQCTANEQQANNRRTTDEQQVNIYKEELEEKESKEEKEVSSAISLKNSNLFRKPKVPSLEEVQINFVSCGGNKEMAEAFFNKHSAVDWFMKGSPITNYKTLIPNFIKIYNENESKSKSNKTRQQTTNESLEYIQTKGAELYAKLYGGGNEG
jgi:hypothetical protein